LFDYLSLSYDFGSYYIEIIVNYAGKS
jgi:hypothetical protein